MPDGANTSGHGRPGAGCPVARLVVAETLAASAGDSREITGMPMLE
jgi:hypothetical protein